MTDTEAVMEARIFREEHFRISSGQNLQTKRQKKFSSYVLDFL